MMEQATRRPWRILADDGERDPCLNLALEEALGRAAGSDPTIRLWRNDRCVVLGRSQIAAAEVDAAACEKLGVSIRRRFTGGGTVYHDAGNLNVTVVLRRDDRRMVERPDLARVPGLYRLVLEPLAVAVSSLGVTALATERDLLVDGAKISGVAAWLGGRSLLVHATLLIDADLRTLEKVLCGPGAPEDPRWERTRSRRAAVTSLALALGVKDGSLGAAAETAVLASIADGDRRPGKVTDEEAAMARDLMTTRYSRPDWHRSGT